eukprot:3525068-Amphidinium_carterae.1
MGTGWNKSSECSSRCPMDSTAMGPLAYQAPVVAEQPVHPRADQEGCQPQLLPGTCEESVSFAPPGLRLQEHR